MGGGGVVVIVMTAATDLVESCTEVAVTVTVPPAGTVEGAVYVVDVPLPVVVVLNEPHALEVPQVTDQVTLALDELLPVDSDVSGAMAN
jgi:hypothetical protein